MQHILSHIQNARLALDVGNIGSAESELGCAAKLVEEKFTSTNNARQEISLCVSEDSSCKYIVRACSFGRACTWQRKTSAVA